MISCGGRLETSSVRYRRQALLTMAPGTHSCYDSANDVVKGGPHLSAEVENQIRNQIRMAERFLKSLTE